MSTWATGCASGWDCPRATPWRPSRAATAARWDALALSVGAVAFTSRPEWRVVVGLGTHVPLEGGLHLHRIYGIPLMPAAALKGVTRLYAEQVEEISAEESAELFGVS